MRYRLKDIFDLQMGKTPARQNMKYWDKSDCKWISIADLSKSEKYISNTKEKISDIAVKETGIRAIPANTVIMSFKLSIGKVAITADNMYSNEAIMAFNDKHVVEMLPEYIFYMFKYMRWDSGSNNAVMGKTLNKATISEIEIDICSIKKQQEIVAILDNIDNILSNKYKEIYLLDELVKARFVEMFGTEQEMNKWNCCTVGDVADVSVGVVIKPTQYYSDVGIPAFRSLNVCEMHVNDNDWVYFTREGHEKNKKSIIKNNDVLVVRSGTPGTACVATQKYEGYNAVDIMIARPYQEKIDSTFLAAFTNMPHGMNQIKTKTGGAAQKHFNVREYKTLTIILPSLKVQQQFADFVRQDDKSKLQVYQYIVINYRGA